MTDDTRLNTLLHRFSIAAQVHQEALEEVDEERANAQARMIDGLLAAILREGDAGRQGLAGLLDHDNPVVAGLAAVYSLDYRTERALEVLRGLASQGGLLGFRASVAIERWEKGEWHPP